MHMILRYPTGRRVDAILLSATSERIRAAVKYQGDTVEFRLVGNRWVSEQGTAIEIESLIADSPSTFARIWYEWRPRMAAAVS